mgnify:CR=1 FL=1
MKELQENIVSPIVSRDETSLLYFKDEKYQEAIL